MTRVSQIVATSTLSISLLFSAGAAAFSGNFELTNIVVDCPSEADSSSTLGSYLSFDFIDQDTPDVPCVHCCLEWQAGEGPPTNPSAGTCSDNNVTVCIPEDSYTSFQNITINLSHSYEDNSIGQYPYNILTKIGYMELEYGTTQYYECDMDIAYCASCEGSTMIAVVTEAVA